MEGWINPQKDCALSRHLCILILNTETIKLQCVSSVELKHATGTSQTKTKLGYFYF